MDEQPAAGEGGGTRNHCHPPEEARDWSDLTPVLLVNVFRRLSVQDRWTGPMLVCRSWLEAARDASLFSSFDLEPYFVDAESARWWTVEFERRIDSMARWVGDWDLGSVREVRICSRWWTAGFEGRIDSMVRSVADWGAGSVREVRIRHCSDRSLSLVAERSPNLEVLSIRSSQNVTDTSISRIALSCPMLRELDISNCYEVSYKSLEMIGKNCPNLIILKRNFMDWLDPSQHTGIDPDEYLRACPQDGDREASVIAGSMPKLKHLELRFSELSATSLIDLSLRCQELEVLDLFGCANLTSRVIEQASGNLKNMNKLTKPTSTSRDTERYRHWRLY